MKYHGSTPPDDPPRDDPAADAGEAVGDVGARLLEALGYAQQYAATYVDQAIATVRNIALWVALGVVGAVVGVSAVVTGTVLLVVGLAQLVGGAINGTLGELPWAGNLIVGAVVVLLATAGGWVAIKVVQTLGYRSAVRKYDRMQARQMMTTGHCAAERAADADGRANPAADPAYERDSKAEEAA